MDPFVVNEDELEEKLKNCCRTCLDEERPKVALFESQFVEILNYLNPDLPMEPDDDLPQFICTRCNSLLEQIVEFQREAKNSYEILQVMHQAVLERSVRPVTCDIEQDNEEEVAPQPQPKRPKRIRTKKYSCEICGKQVESPSKLRRHLRSHEPPKQKAPAEPTVYRCHFCQKELPGAAKLKKHLESHLPPEMRPRTHRCTDCGTDYLDAASLRVHMALKHADVVPTFKCPICGALFTRKNYRDYHVREHTASKSWTCGVKGCLFRTARRHNLSRHMKTHLKSELPPDDPEK